MSASIVNGSDFHLQATTPLFQTPPGTIFGGASADGARFLLVQSGSAPFTVVLNWLKR